MQICPCCQKEFQPPPVDQNTEDMDNLFSCDHCQSIMKWENQSLKVVYESKEVSPSVSSNVDDQEVISSEKEEEILSEEVDQVSSSEFETASSEELGAEEAAPLDNERKENFPEQKELHDSLDQDHIAEEESMELPIDLGQQEQEEQNVNPASEELEVEEEEAEALETQDVKQDFSDVEEYGNAQATSEKGFLRYDLHISGLDSSEIEQHVLAILEDPRFKWDAKEILQMQKEGILVIENLNPIKAMCLVSELSFLPVLELSWKQYMAVDAQVTGETEE